MKKRTRICTKCNQSEETFSKSLICAGCANIEKTNMLIEAEHEELSALGYDVTAGPFYDNHNHRKWKVITPCCGGEYEPLVLTVRSMLKRRGILPCASCGGKERMSAAMDAYRDVHGRDYDVLMFEDYRSLVRSYSEKTYAKWKHIINPEDLPRGHAEYHLDHKVPILWCFKEKIPVVIASSIHNLQMLKFDENIRKNDTPPENPYEVLLKDTVHLLDYSSPVFVHGKLNLWPHQLKLDVLNGMLLYRGHKAQKINARDLKVKSVQPNKCKDFLNENHLAGYVPAKYAYGLFCGDELMMLLTLGIPRFSKHDLEVIRVATKGGVVVRGGVSKLVARAKQHHAGAVVCYSDMHVGDGNVYSQVGFTFDGDTGPGYFWEKDNVILQRYQTQKHKLQALLGDAIDMTLSESDLMKNHGWRKVTTFGNKRWVATW